MLYSTIHTQDLEPITGVKGEAELGKAASLDSAI